MLIWKLRLRRKSNVQEKQSEDEIQGSGGMLRLRKGKDQEELQVSDGRIVRLMKKQLQEEK